jgi:hypothetical protein
MIIEINNPLHIVSDAFIQKSEKSLSLFINTKERSIRPDAYGSGDNYFEIYYFKETHDDDAIPHDVVKIIAEDEKEKMFLSCCHFELMAKNQLWMIFLPEEIYK